MSPLFISKKRAVRAFLIEMSMLPSQAPSIRQKALRVASGIDRTDVHLRADFLGLPDRRVQDSLCLRPPDFSHLRKVAAWTQHGADHHWPRTTPTPSVPRRFYRDDVMSERAS